MKLLTMRNEIILFCLLVSAIQFLNCALLNFDNVQLSPNLENVQLSRPNLDNVQLSRPNLDNVQLSRPNLDNVQLSPNLDNVQLSLTGLVEPKSVSVSGVGIEKVFRLKPKLGSIARPSKSVLNNAVQVAKTSLTKLEAFDKQQVSLGKDKSNSETPMFGPHLITNDAALEIGRAGDLFLQTAKTTVSKLRIKPSLARASLQKIPIPFIPNFKCPYSIKPRCTRKRSYPYRQADGSCNNLINPLWGRANTPFERFIPGFYDDGIQSPRQTSAVSGSKLPGARAISLKVHEASTSSHQTNDVNHLTMLFGQFLSHDIQRNALSKGYGGSNLDCCRVPNRRNCFPIPIAKNDPHFGRFRRTCMNLVRALATPSLDCKFGQREQLNQVTHFLDGSHIYGSDSSTMKSLRLRSGGKLKSTNNDLLPKDMRNGAACILTNPHNKCFIAGDVRVNQQPMLMSFHTIWMKEHNRVAERLTIENPHWNDEKLFQESRKIVIAELQHITYNEYLPEILGSLSADLKPKSFGYFTGYNNRIKPQIRNIFAAAAFRMGHSMIRDKVAYRKASGTTRQQYLFRTFLRPDLLYSPLAGVDGVTRGLYESFSQSVDRFVTKQVTNHLFERTPGFGGDLAAINIQRGRDHGMANYNTWRMACGLKPAQTFKSQSAGGLLDHNTDAAKALSKIYTHPDDIDVFTGGVSEIPVTGGQVGPLFACLISLQFKALKYGDRFFYESNNVNVKFTPKQLAEIRKTTLARVICDNTITDRLPVNSFRKASFPSNPNKNCNSFVKFDFQYWKDCVDGGWSSWTSVHNIRCLQRRFCNNPRPQSGCGKPCTGLSTRFRCGSIGIEPGRVTLPPFLTIHPPKFTLRPIFLQTIRPPFRDVRPPFRDVGRVPGRFELAHTL